jgi:hypothetical protein
MTNLSDHRRNALTLYYSLMRLTGLSGPVSPSPAGAVPTGGPTPDGRLAIV